ncbi:MAG: hypothetical protein U0S12_08815 [Fimbriimonadales bacterium]
MASLLLIAGPGKSWREYLDANLGSRDLILLDPAETRFGCAGARVSGSWRQEWWLGGSGAWTLAHLMW